MDATVLDATVMAAAGAPFAPTNALTSQREMFCRVYVACGNAAEAARQAGYASGSARQQGYRLLDDETIRHRIQELWAEADGAHATDRDLLMDKTEQLFDAAMGEKNFNAAARALGLQARLAGFTGPARDREEIVPGRPGPVARAAARKAAKEREQGARQDDTGIVATADGGRLKADPSSADAHPCPSAPRQAGPHGTAGGTRQRPDDSKAPGVTMPDADARPAAGPDPWAEAARIERERQLAGVHSSLCGLRRREAQASEAAAAQEAAELAA